jgi:hypothetical protein
MIKSLLLLLFGREGSYFLKERSKERFYRKHAVPIPPRGAAPDPAVPRFTGS